MKNKISEEEYKDGLCDLTLPIKVRNLTHEHQMNFNEDSKYLIYELFIEFKAHFDNHLI